MSNFAAPKLSEADRLLKQFNCLNRSNQRLDQIPIGDRASLRQALLQVAAASDYQMLGVCADTLEQGRAALAAYTHALTYQPSLELQPIEGPVYIKFNSRTMSCYASSYEGEHRGVLVSCQSPDADGINEMYGHLPLDLFAD